MEHKAREIERARDGATTDEAGRGSARPRTDFLMYANLFYEPVNGGHFSA